MSDSFADDAVIVLNPTSGSGDHVDDVEHRAALAGIEVRRTRREGHGVDLASEAAAAGANTVVAAGGDGTLNEVVRGVVAADALDDVAVGVIPVGTGNNFAGNVGVPDVDAAFRALREGERRRVDLGWADDRPFVNSCVGGITADASSATTSELKSELGVLAYLVTTLETVASFEELELSVRVRDPEGHEAAWSDEAIAVLVGNGRRFTDRGSTQANLEDGLLEITVVRDVPAVELVREALHQQLLQSDDEAARHLRAPALEVEVRNPDGMTFSLDGEIVETGRIELSTEPRALRLVVGETYDPDPDAADSPTESNQRGGETESLDGRTGSPDGRTESLDGRTGSLDGRTRSLDGRGERAGGRPHAS